MKKIILIFLFSFCLISIIKSENDTISNKVFVEQGDQDLAAANAFSLNKLVFGGNIGFGFSNNYTYVNIQPRISYRLSKWIAPGVTFMYQYSRHKLNLYDLKYNTWGGGVFAYIYPIRFVYAHIEYQHLWYNQINTSPDGIRLKDDNNYLLLGAGVNIPVGGNVYLNASILFNVLDDKHNIYQNPIYSVGVGVNL